MTAATALLLVTTPADGPLEATLRSLRDSDLKAYPHQLFHAAIDTVLDSRQLWAVRQYFPTAKSYRNARPVTPELALVRLRDAVLAAEAYSFVFPVQAGVVYPAKWFAARYAAVLASRLRNPALFSLGNLDDAPRPLLSC